MTVPKLVVAGFLIATCGFAGWSDLFRRLIPNWLCAATALSGLAVAVANGGLALAGNHALHAGIVLVAGMALFTLRVLGGGDAKFYAAVATWFDLRSALGLFILITFCGFFLLVVWFVSRRLAGKPIRKKASNSFDSLPYGIAIALGAIIMNFMANW